MSVRKVTIGGQAVIEGVMMKSPDLVVTSVRKTNGEIISKIEPYISLAEKKRVLGLPVLRGAINLFEQLYLGIKSLTFSAEVASAGEEEIKSDKGWKSSFLTGTTVIIALGVGLLLFFYLPLVIASSVGAKGTVLFNIVDGIVRLAIFFAYLGVLNMWKEMRRVFEYHGAEHKSIHALENGESLSIENVKKYTTRHPRCGTSFLLIVMVISIVIFVFMGRPEGIRDRLLRLCAVPLIAGISYEMIKLAGKHKSGFLMRIVSAPGLALQRFTTREPSEDQIEVALEALRMAASLEVRARHVGSS